MPCRRPRRSSTRQLPWTTRCLAAATRKQALRQQLQLPMTAHAGAITADRNESLVQANDDCYSSTEPFQQDYCHPVQLAGAMLVRGKRYTVTWGDAERLPAGLVLDLGLVRVSSS